MADSSKTEQATGKRRQKAREQGQVARSRELPSVLAIVGAAAALAMMSKGAITHWTTFYRNMLDTAATGNFDSNGPMLFWSAVEVFRWIVPVLLTAVVLSVAAALVQGGFSLAPQAMALKFERFNPAIFSSAGLNNLLKSLLPFAAIAWIGEHSLSAHWGVLVQASSFGLRQLTEIVSGMMYEVGWKACLVLIAWYAV